MSLLNTPESTDICKDCGFCCTHMIRADLFSLPDDEVEDAAKYYKGVDIKLFRYKNHYYTVMKRKCKYYDGKTKSCKQYDTRPKVCRDFPGKSFSSHLVKWCPLMGIMRKNGEL